MTRALSALHPFGAALLAAGLLLLALCLLRHLRDQARLRALQGDALALLGVAHEPRTPLFAPAVALLTVGLYLLRGGGR